MYYWALDAYRRPYGNNLVAHNRPLRGFVYYEIQLGGLFLSVSDLSVSVGPATVTRLIVAVHVNSIQGHGIRPITHVGIEVSEDLPALTHLDSSGTVGVVALMVRVGTPLDHSVPSVILGGTELRSFLVSLIVAKPGVFHTSILALISEKSRLFMRHQILYGRANNLYRILQVSNASIAGAAQ